MQLLVLVVRGCIARAAALAMLAIAAGATAIAQVPGPQAAQPYMAAPATQNFEALVAPIALYPDELLAVVLRAATEPVQVVQAARFLDRLARDKSLQPNPAWSEPVRVLVNYPEMLRKMSRDLDWTEQLGDAVRSQQSDVLAAVQQFRRRVAAAGNLRSDDKLTVAQEGPVYIIESTNPQVIYVPVYDPSVVVVPQPAPPPPVYVPTPYPAYYDPYPAAAAAATGFFFGALTTAWAMDWYHYDIDEDDLHEFQQYRQQSLSQRQQARQDAAAQRQQTRQSSQAERQQGRQESRAQRQQARQERQDARGDLQPGQQPMGSGTGRQDLGSILSGEQRPGQRPGGPGSGLQQQRPGGSGGGFQPQQRPAQGYDFQRQGSFGSSLGERPGYQPPAGARVDTRRGGGDAFSYGAGNRANQASDRGFQSRSYGGGREFSGSRGGGGRGGGRGGRR